jgi:hypothetical protein
MKAATSAIHLGSAARSISAGVYKNKLLILAVFNFKRCLSQKLTSEVKKKLILVYLCVALK